MGELLTKKVLFPGKSEMDMINKIFDILGTPTEENWPSHKKLPGFASVCTLSAIRSITLRRVELVPMCLTGGKQNLCWANFLLCNHMLVQAMHVMDAALLGAAR